MLARSSRRARYSRLPSAADFDLKPGCLVLGRARGSLIESAAGLLGFFRPGTVRVLCYHAISELPVLGSYCIPPQVLDAQLHTLRRHGYRPIGAEEFLGFLRGADAPGRAVLVTFDDAFADFASTALPILERHGVKPVVFAVSRHLGGFNEWDQAIGAPLVSLLGAAGLRDCARRGCEIGAHSQTHPLLPDLGPDQLMREISGALEDLEMAGLPRPRLFAYPYGAHDDRVLSAARQANLGAAFTVAPGLVRRTSDPLAVPRIEVFRGDSGWRFRLKVATAGHFPTWLQSVWASLRSRLRKITRPPAP